MNKYRSTPLRKLLGCVIVLLIGAVVVVGVSYARTVWSQYQIDRRNAENVESAQKIKEEVVASTTQAPSITTTIPAVPDPGMVDGSSTTTSTTTTTLPPLPSPPTSLAPVELFGGMTYERLGLEDSPIFEGNIADNDAAALDLGLAHLAGVPLPGGGGNVVIGGHRTSHLRPFHGLDDATIGDDITVVTTWGVYVYRVYDVWLAVPARNTAEMYELYDVHFVSQDRPGETLTLYACTPEGETTHRIIVHADLVSVNGRPVA